LENVAAQQSREDPDAPPIVADLSTAQVELIKAVFGKDKVATFSFEEWARNKEDVIRASDDSVLFLVDRDFSYEIPNSRDKGFEILKDLFGRAEVKGTFVLFSHSFVQNEELQERELFSSKQDCNAVFAFVSKERLTRNRNDVDEQDRLLASALQDALVRVWCHRVSAAAIDVVGKAIRATERQLLNQTFDDLGGGIFHLSQRDGVAEIETMARIFMLAGRVAMQEELQMKSELQRRLVGLRRITKAINYTPPVEKKLSPKMNEWRNWEIWDPPVVVNGCYSQPSCGDVYVTTNEKDARTFILLGQPCNLAVRAGGQRKDQEALFAECHLNKATDSCYELKWDDTVRFASFDYVYPINLVILDAVASSSTGDVRLEINKPLPVELLLGMTKRLIKMVSGLTGAIAQNGVLPYKYRAFSVSEKLKLPVDLKLAEGIFSIPLKRIGRVRSPYANAVFGTLANHHTRMAFDYDFSRIPKRL
jgi:hypothetical protein